MIPLILYIARSGFKPEQAGWIVDGPEVSVPAGHDYNGGYTVDLTGRYFYQWYRRTNLRTGTKQMFEAYGCGWNGAEHYVLRLDNDPSIQNLIKQGWERRYIYSVFYANGDTLGFNIEPILGELRIAGGKWVARIGAPPDLSTKADATILRQGLNIIKWDGSVLSITNKRARLDFKSDQSVDRPFGMVPNGLSMDRRKLIIQIGLQLYIGSLTSHKVYFSPLVVHGLPANLAEFDSISVLADGRLCLCWQKNSFYRTYIYDPERHALTHFDNLVIYGFSANGRYVCWGNYGTGKMQVARVPGHQLGWR